MYNIYVGTDIGLFKGVNTKTKKFENLNDVKGIVKDDGIVSMCWKDASQKEILMAQKNQIVKIYDCNHDKFKDVFKLDMGDGIPKNLAINNHYIITSVDSGVVKVWGNDDHTLKKELKVGNELSVMRHNINKPNQIATGGKVNDLKIWDINRKDVPIFKAKNVAANYLDVRQPIWIKDIQFVPESKTVVTGTAYHQVRLYDLASSNMKPVIDMEFEEHPISAIAITPNQHQVVVGNTHGRMGLVDLRKKRLVHKFKNVAGSIRNIQVHPALPLVISSCIDRYIRIHDLSMHTLTSRIFLKSKLTSVLLCTQDIERNQLFFGI